MKVCWNITSKCNRKCEYCFKFNEQDLVLKQNIEILKVLIKNGVNQISWSGGGPFLYNDLLALLKMAKENGIKNSVITNLTTINEQNLVKLI